MVNEVPFGTPAQSEHVVLSPSHTPHWSKDDVPPHTPAQSWTQDVSSSVTQSPHKLVNASPSQVPAQSSIAPPLLTPAQSTNWTTSSSTDWDKVTVPSDTLTINEPA